MTLATLFLAQAMNVPPSLGQQLTILGIAIDPGHRHADFEGRQRGDRRELITLAATLPVVADIPIAGLALLAGVDRFMSECRALTNLDCARVRKELARGPAPPAAVSTATGSPN